MLKSMVAAQCRLYTIRNATRSRLLALSNDKRGVVSFEYVIVAACIVAAVSFAFGTNGGAGIGKALSDAITAITAKVTTAVG